MTNSARSALFLLLVALGATIYTACARPGREWHAAPNGSGDGSASAPFSLAAALQNKEVEPGDTVYLRGGTYAAPFISTLTGAPGAPVIVRPYDGDRVIIDGIGIPDRQLEGNVVTIRGSDAEYWNLEVQDSSPTRSYPDRSIPRPTGISVYGQRIKLINPIVRDAGNGIGLWNSGDSEVYGALVFNNGAMTPVPSGHGFYIQNDLPETTTRVSNSLSFNNFQMGLHAYGEGGTIEGLMLDQFVAFNNGSPSLGNARRDANLFIGPRSNGGDRISITRSHAYHPPFTAGLSVRLGYTANNRSAVVRDSYFMSGSHPITFTSWDSVTFEGNTVYATQRPPDMTYYERAIVAQNLDREGPYIWRNNTYYDQTTPESGTVYHPFEVIPPPSGFGGEFAHWQVAMEDWTSKYHIGKPPDRIFVLPNKYESGRAHIVVYNWSKKSQVSVDLDSVGLRRGEAYTILDVQELSARPVATGTYRSRRPAVIRMNRTRVDKPLGWDTVFPHTAPEFAVFLVIPNRLLPD